MSGDSTQIPDAELFALLREEKHKAEVAFAELYARYSGRVYAYCLRFLGSRDEAQDAFQDTFVRFYECAKGEREMTNVPGFLLKIARNLCLNRRRDRKPTTDIEHVESYIQTKQNENTELLQLVTMAMDMLPDDYREAFLLREYQGFSYEEISTLLDVPLSTVKIRIFRAKQKIRSLLAPYIADVSHVR